MRRLIRRLIAAIVTVASLVGLALTMTTPKGGLSQLQWLVLVVAALAFVAECWFAVSDFRAQKVTVIKRDGNFEKAIQSYMQSWLKKGGRTAIYSRDMTWASNSATRELLLKKASANELVICVPHIPVGGVVAELKEAGADVLTYEKLGCVPAARFTVINYGRADSEVAIGLADGEVHRIEELRTGQHPAAMLSVELVKLLEALPENVR